MWLCSYWETLYHIIHKVIRNNESVNWLLQLHVFDLWALNGRRGDIPHPERTESTFLPLTMAALGRGWVVLTHSWGGELHQAPPDKIFLRRAHSFEPNLLYMWFYWQGHQYLWVMSCCSPETHCASALLCGAWYLWTVWLVRGNLVDQREVTAEKRASENLLEGSWLTNHTEGEAAASLCATVDGLTPEHAHCRSQPASNNHWNVSLCCLRGSCLTC